MFSNVNKFIFFIFSIIILNSCSNEEISKDDSLVVNLAYDTDCFTGLVDRWEEWGNGRGEASKVESDFNCIADGVSYFLLRVRGNKLGLYSSQEIFNFTEKFFKDSRIDKTLIDDVLILKSWIIGGSANEISFEELSKISWFLKMSLPALKDLTPQANKLFFKSSDQLITDQDAIVLKKSLSLITKNLNSLTLNSDIFVTKENFELQINKLLQQFNFNPISSENIKSFWSLASLSLGLNESSSLSFKPALGLLDLASKAYYIGLRFKYGIVDVGWRALGSRVHLDSVINESLVLLKNLVNNQENKNFSKNRLGVMFYEVFKFIEFDFELNSAWIEDVIQVFFNRYFESQTLGQSEVEILSEEWQKFTLFNSETLVLQGLGFSGSLVQVQNFVTLSDLNRRTLDFSTPMLSNSNGYILNPLKKTEIIADYGNLFWLNWQRALSSVFLKMYTDDPALKNNLTGITIQQLQTGYADIFRILNGINYLSDDEDGGWFRIFNEGNLFVPRADPDLYLNFEEGVDYFALLFSGIAFSGDIYKQMKASCVNDSKSCQLDWFRKSDKSVWQDFAPDFYTYLSQIEDDEWDSLAEGFEQMARETIQPEPFKKFQILKVSIATQYIEIFLRRYDLNQDLKINFSETVNSFDNFKSALLSLPQIKGTEAEDDPVTLLAFYTFFLKKGRLPRKTFGRYIELLGWLKKVENCVIKNPDGSLEAKLNIQGCEYESSRANLMKILAFLSNSI